MNETVLQTVSKRRIWELDFLKGVALVLMILNHIIFDLYSFFGFDVSSLSFFRDIIGIISSVIFMTVCGVSLTLGKHNIKRGIIVFSLGVALTLFTFVFDKFTNSGALILFGILHFLGVAMIIGHFAKKLPLPVIAMLAFISFALGYYFKSLTIATPFFFPLGITNRNFYSSDYFPLFPNLGYVFLGIIIGKTVYKKKESIFSFSPKKSLMCFLGKHTLVLYFAHQPVIFGLIFVVDWIFKSA